MAQRVGLRLPLGDAIAETYRAMFLNAVLPGGVLGDVDRAVRHGRSSGDVGARGPGGGHRAHRRPAGAARRGAGGDPGRAGLVVEIGRRVSRTPLLGLALVVVLVRAGRRAGGRRRGRRTARRARPAGGAGCSRETAADVRAGALSRGAWPLLLLLSAAALAGYLVLFLIAARMAGATAPTLALLPPLLLALMAMGLPISVGGWGPREGVAALTFWMAGLGAPLGVTTSVAYGALALIASLPGGARAAGPPAGPVPAAGAVAGSAPVPGCRCPRSGPGTARRSAGRRGRPGAGAPSAAGSASHPSSPGEAS